MKRSAIALVLAILAATASADAPPMPARSGDSGLLDVPDAEVQGVGHGLLGLEYRFDRAKGSALEFGPLPIYAVGGLLPRLDFGLAVREGGQPADQRPARIVFGGALKYQLVAPRGSVPAIAVGLVADRVNRGEVLGGRLIVSTDAERAIRLSAFAGAEGGGDSGFAFGGALAFRVGRRTDAILEGLGGPRGENLGAGLRFKMAPTVALGVSLNYLPGEQGFRASVGLGFGPAPKQRDLPASPSAQPAAPGAAAAEEKAAAVAFRDDKPRFRMKIRVADASSAEPRSVRHGPWSGPAATSTMPRPGAPGGVRPVAPSLEDLAEEQLREQEALADQREKRVRGAADGLAARERTAAEEPPKLEERERDLAAREQQLDLREKRVASALRGPAPLPQRQLEDVEAQLALEERNLAAQERSFVPALDAAGGRERDAAAREEAERAEAQKLAASVSGASTRALQLEVRKQSLGARNRQLAALEARLLAKGERLDALERQLHTRSERGDAWQRRLDARAERIDLLDRLAAQPGAAAAPRPADAKGAAAREKAVFVVVAKSPTAVLKDRAAVAAPSVPDAALHPGVAVEKTVAAAAVLAFAAPDTHLAELDREAVVGIAKLAAKERCELLIWARAKEPSLLEEAQRRAAELRALVVAVGPLDPKQVVTRLTTRPGAHGVDVLVSALREPAKPAPAPSPAAAAPSLLEGESGKRQIREAVQSAQPSIEACAGDLVQQRNLQRAEAVLRIAVSSAGRVTKVAAVEGDLSGAALDACLAGASRAWPFPPAEGDYAVDVPITVLRGEAR